MVFDMEDGFDVLNWLALPQAVVGKLMGKIAELEGKVAILVQGPPGGPGLGRTPLWVPSAALWEAHARPRHAEARRADEAIAEVVEPSDEQYKFVRRAELRVDLGMRSAERWHAGPRRAARSPRRVLEVARGLDRAPGAS